MSDKYSNKFNRKIINKSESFQTEEELSHTLKSDSNTNYLDFDDILKEIDRLMLQIGWTKDNGRDYLLKTYGKRSRYSLEDFQLLEFLDFLREQVES